jgi:hypothetical protein
MSYQYHGTRDLIAMPGRSVQTFPSGLVRVERSFMCRKGDVARYRNILRVNEPMPFDNGAPAIDGLFIFPEPQEQVRDDGFVEFRVTAYGRTLPPNLNKIEKSTARSSINTTGAVQQSINETYTIRGVSGKDESAISVLRAPAVADPIILLSPGGERFLEGASKLGTLESGLDLIQVRRISIVLDSYSSTNFGIWNEIVITYIAVGSVFTVLR